ncbi:glycosyltransferase family 4 protein [Aestuariivivens sediminis]|uniref:glycosyltransferase family 4 protein n=1 Tax=Aestuariivivens sediminis TaxID=2913557 RepID=UPI001F585378|nr:glycosyltransferase family 4 protein [Aestuariivivens sediminis]
MYTFFIQHRSPHHAKSSGYDRLLDYYPNAKSMSGQPGIPYQLAKVVSGFVNQKAGVYNSDSLNKDIELFKCLRKPINTPAIVHYLNAERDIRFVVKYKSLFKNVQFCATFHKPPSVLTWRISNPKYVRHLDGAVAVGENQLGYIREHFKIKEVAYIPHGVDTQFFYPDATQRHPNRLLFVGQHLRDFEALNYCVPRIAEKIRGLSIHVIVHPAYKPKVDFHESITVLSGLSDMALRQAYQEGSLLFLPMKDSTACNSILEAMACGLPVVTSNVGGNSEYLEGTNSVLVPRTDYHQYIASVVTLLSDPEKINELAVLARQKALSYDWKVISKQIMEFHSSLSLK